MTPLSRNLSGGNEARHAREASSSKTSPARTRNLQATPSPRCVLGDGLPGFSGCGTCSGLASVGGVCVFNGHWAFLL